ncbi:MAG: murein transglycosylase A [Flavobacteriaceae bacterium]
MRIAAAILAFCLAASPVRTVAATVLADGSRLEPVAFADLSGWGRDNPAQALKAFRHSCAKSSSGRFAGACAAAGGAGLSAGAARAFFEKWFEPFRVAPAKGKGFVTGYFEPELEGSLEPDAHYRYPLLARPDDLKDIDPDKPPRGVARGLRAARRTAAGWEAYPTRAEIETGALGPAPEAVVYLEDPVDAFFVQIQGSARIHLPDESIMRVGFAGRNGHPYTPVGRVLIDEGLMRKEELTADRLRDWLKSHPAEAERIMRRNESYIFFRELPVGDPSLGPVGAAGVPLTPLRSIAVDHKVHAYGTPVFLSGDLPVGPGGAMLGIGQLMIAQDTGSAIVGAARGDIFFGAGDAAGFIAGLVQHEVDFYVLLPKEARR